MLEQNTESQYLAILCIWLCPGFKVQPGGWLCWLLLVLFSLFYPCRYWYRNLKWVVTTIFDIHPHQHYKISSLEQQTLNKLRN